MSRASATGEAHDVDSTVAQDYLKAVWAACEWGGAGASITGLARRMGVAASTASENVARLVEAGLLEHEPYRAVTLSEEGRRRAMGMIRRHRILETYLVTRLGFEWDEVHAEAEVLEHAVSERLLAALDAALGHPVRDPHGDPIPAADGRIVQPALRSIDTVGVGRTVVVGRIRDESSLLRDLRRAGIGLDTPVRVVSRDSGPASGAWGRCGGDGGAGGWLLSGPRSAWRARRDRSSSWGSGRSPWWRPSCWWWRPPPRSTWISST